MIEAKLFSENTNMAEKLESINIRVAFCDERQADTVHKSPILFGKTAQRQLIL